MQYKFTQSAGPVCFLAFRGVAEMAEPNRNRQTARPGLRRTIFRDRSRPDQSAGVDLLAGLSLAG
jgi:hypothetical protein